MLLLVSGTTKSVTKWAEAYPGMLGHFLVPRAGNSVRSTLGTGLPWAVDNGCFGGFDPAAFWSLLGRFQGKPGCLWVVCPDKVADAKTTLGLFQDFYEEIALWRKFKIAFVGQDGQEELDAPWDYFDCFFVGGSTRWKLSRAAYDLCQEAKRRGKWVHIGRVNSKRRMESAWLMGADSIDGSSASRFGEKKIPQYLRWIRNIQQQQLMTYGPSCSP